MFCGQGLLGRDGAARWPLAGDDACPHGGRQRGVSALPWFGFDEAHGVLV
jgi:hypothetical protein